ncbi:MAG: sigma-70 family RNA polymerase sigma factor [Gemmatimonadetes bacterium]|nr:sigma-70 family RNA polymerase sigma factor [Gemmatimonadota bacterium]
MSFQAETRAFDDLLNEHSASLYLQCLHYTRDADEADDLVQDSVISALLKLHDLEDEERFGPWLRTIALNHCRRWSRHQRRYRRLENDAELVDGAASAEVASESREKQELVADGMGRLSRDHRQVVCLFYLEDRSLKQIAASLGLSLQAASQRLYRARIRLREELGIVMTQQNHPMALRQFARSQTREAVDIPWPPSSRHMSLDSLRGLERVHDEQCLLLSRTLSDLASCPLDVDTVFVDQTYLASYHHYLGTRTSPGPVCSFVATPLPGRASLEIRSPLAEALGCKGDGLGDVLQAILSDLQSAMCTIQPASIGDLHLDDVKEPHGADNDLVQVVGVQVGRPEWWMIFCYPLTMLLPWERLLESAPAR